MDEVVAYERRLWRAAQQRSCEAAGSELAEILDVVATRRANRSDRVARRDASDRSPEIPLEGTSGAPGRVLAVEDVSPDVRILRIGRPPELHFEAGQHLKLGVPSGRTGTFSIASAPHEPHLEFCVELIPGGRLTPALFALTPGDAVELAADAKGAFRLHEAPRHLMVATVTGIAPLRSMFRDALHRGRRAEFEVLHGASHSDELPYLAELTALSASSEHIRYRPTVSQPSAVRNVGWRGDTGRVDDLACRVAASLEPTTTQVYACGHSAMVQRMRDELGASGFDVATEMFD